MKSPRFPTSLQLFSVAATSLGALVGHTGAETTAAPVTVTWSVDGGPNETVTLTGVPNQAGGLTYSTLLSGCDGACSFLVVINADANADPLTNANGILKITNNDSVTHEFQLAFDVPICPAIDGETTFGVTTIATLTTNGSGSLVCTGNGIIDVLASGNVVKSLFVCPYQLGTSGSGTLTVSSQFGTPGASAIGPAVVFSQGLSTQFLLTDADNVQFVFTYNLQDNDGPTPNTCAPDLNHDGVVSGQDLTLLLSKWAETSDCPSTLLGDIDESGAVDGGDIATMLSLWGACPS